MAPNIMDHPIRWHGRGSNSWEPRCDMDCDGSQANENGHKLFYR